MSLERPIQIFQSDNFDTFDLSGETELFQELWSVICWRVLGITTAFVLIQELLRGIGSNTTRLSNDFNIGRQHTK